MIEMVIWLVVIAAFVFRALKKNGTLDELFAGAKKRKENKAERVVYEQPEEGSGKKEKKKGPGIRVPKHTGLAQAAQGHRTFHERPARRKRSLCPHSELRFRCHPL